MRDHNPHATTCILLALLGTILVDRNSVAAEKMASPVAAELIRVIDGDTV